MINPKIANKLLEDVPEMRELIEFINLEADKLNKLSDPVIDLLSDPIELSIEIKARKRAYEALERILEPLVFRQEISQADNSEFNV